MPQRRGVGSKASNKTTVIDSDEDIPLAPKSRSQAQKPGSLNLEGPSSASNGTTTSSDAGGTAVSMEERYENESYNLKVKHWKESPFAVGLTEITWEDERLRMNQRSAAAGDDQSMDDANCLCCSALVCPNVPGVVRVGNMSVLKQSTYSVDVQEEDEETGEMHIVRVVRPKLDCIVGPYWPMLVLVTYPLILGVSGWALLRAVPGKPLYIQAVWFLCTGGLIISLAFTACCDPGIMYRRHSPPRKTQTWRWSDQAQTYRPRGAIYDPDTAVVVEGFDHTCPWTGTAIGRKNMLSFQFFVCLVFICLVMDILLLTKSLGSGGGK